MSSNSMSQCTLYALELLEARKQGDGELYSAAVESLADTLYPILVANAHKFMNIGVLLENPTLDPNIFNDDPDLEQKIPRPEICVLVNEAWMHIIEKIDKFDPAKGAFENWSIVVAKLRWFDLYRKMSRRLAHRDSRADLDKLNKTGYSPEELIIKVEEVELKYKHRGISNRKRRNCEEFLAMYQDLFTDWTR